MSRKAEEFITMQQLQDGITEKIQSYKVWLDRGIIDQAEFVARREAMTSLESLLEWKSQKLPTKETA